MTKPHTTWLAVGLLIAIAVMAFMSSRGDSAIVDEVPHLTAGYAYVTRGDMRLNPEHPPLAKDLAGLAIISWSDFTGTKLSFPDSHIAWTDETNAQWTLGPEFLYHQDVDAATVLQRARFPTLLIFVAFGWWLFVWTRRHFRPWVAGLTLFFYALSPTVIAHARFVTTDLAAAAAFFCSFTAWLWWWRQPNLKRTIVFGVVFGLAQLVKFSLLLLVPLFPAVMIILGILNPQLSSLRRRVIGMLNHLGRYSVVLVVAFGFVVTPIYVIHTIGYPIEKQRQDVAVWSSFFENAPIADYIRWSVDKPVLRATGHYLTGVLLVQNRSHFGSRTSFMGTVDNTGRPWYFPVVYATKEPLAFHALTLVVLSAGAVVLYQRRRSWQQAGLWLSAHRADVGAVAIVAWYWWTSIHSELNIGVRHILPTLPFIFFLVARSIATLGEFLRRCRPRLYTPSLAVMGALLGWQLVSVLGSYPSFLSYYNALAGGPEGGAYVATDSNLDWGQDLRRLAAFVNKHGITSIHVDYFGGGDLATTLPGVAYEYHVQDGPVTGWLALSRSYWMNETSRKGPSVPPGPNRYAWLEAYQPVAVIGHSIAVYNIPDEQ